MVLHHTEDYKNINIVMMSSIEQSGKYVATTLIYYWYVKYLSYLFCLFQRGAITHSRQHTPLLTFTLDFQHAHTLYCILEAFSPVPRPSV